MAEENKKIIEMADRRKAIEEMYSGDEQLLRVFEKARSSSLNSIFTRDNLEKIISRVGSNGLDRKEVGNLANFAYATDPIYAGIIDYLSNMFLWRYYYFPVKIRDKASDADFGPIYELMTQIIDGLSVETTFPHIMTKLFKEGAVYLYTVKDSKSKTISTLILNASYCKPILVSQYGTGVFQFDVKYFDELGLKGDDLEQALEFFPEELTSAFRSWKAKIGPRYIIVDGRFSTYININEFGFPSQLSVLQGVFDYAQYRQNEIDRNTARLDTIITHKIPHYEGRLLFELKEASSLHRSMARHFASNKRVKFMTSFGDLEVHQIQTDLNTSIETLETAQKAIYRTASLNSNVFMGDKEEALAIGLTKDASIVWKYVQQLINFYNLTINNLYNFKGYQIQLTMLPITHYNVKEMMEIHRKNAEFGIGRLEVIVASGTKQGHIEHKAKLEDFLQLDKILKPLSSSHTQTKTPETPSEEDKTETDVEEDEQDKENNN